MDSHDFKGSMPHSASAVNRSKTARHDDMHLWFNQNIDKVMDICVKFPEVENPVPGFYECLQYINGYGDYGRAAFADVEYSDFRHEVIDIRRELPIYTGKYLQGVSDVVIRYKINATKKTTYFTATKNGRYYSYFEAEKGYDKGAVIRAYDTDNVTYRRDIDEQFRHRTSGSGSIERKIIVEFKPVIDSVSGVIGQLKVYKDCLGEISDMCIATYDKNTKYDSLLQSENIKIIRIDDSDD
jgi:hypothetical protein